MRNGLGCSVPIGIAIGLILYNNRKGNRNADSADVKETETAGADAQEVKEVYPTETFRSSGS